MESRALDRRIRVERATVVENDLGEEVPAWAPLDQVWASVKWVRDSERFSNVGELSSSVQVRFQIRWGLGVTVEDRIIYDGKTYSILGVKELGRLDGQEISAVARGEVVG